MPESKWRILSTGPVQQELVQEAKEHNILLDTVSFIATEPVQAVDVQQEVEQVALQYATVIFTSKHAVEAVITILDQQIPAWNIYGIGNTTQQLIANYFGEDAIAGSAHDAASLATLITEQEEADEVFFFCGDLRRNELPSQLEQAGITVQEIVVYRTVHVHKKIQEAYHGILFFSPSAADSFFTQNHPANNTILFAIGKTTEATIKKYSDNTIITAVSPGKKELVRMAIDHFRGSEQ